MLLCYYNADCYYNRILFLKQQKPVQDRNPQKRVFRTTFRSKNAMKYRLRSTSKLYFEKDLKNCRIFLQGQGKGQSTTLDTFPHCMMIDQPRKLSTTLTKINK